MCGGDGDGVGTFVDELADVGDDTIFIQGAVSLAVRRNGSATHEAEVAVAGGLDQLMRFFADALDIAQSEEASEAIVVIDDEQFEDLLAIESYFTWLHNGEVHDMFKQSRSDFEMFVGAIFDQTGPVPLFKTETQSPRLQEYYDGNYRTTFVDPNDNYRAEDMSDDGETVLTESEAYEKTSWSERFTMTRCGMTAGEILASRPKPRKQPPQTPKPKNEDTTTNYTGARRTPQNHDEAMLQDELNGNTAWARAEETELERLYGVGVLTRSGEVRALEIERLYETGAITSPEQHYKITYTYKIKESHTCRMVIDEAHKDLLKDVIDTPTSDDHDHLSFKDYEDPMMKLMLPDPMFPTTTDGRNLITRKISRIRKVDEDRGYEEPEDRPFEPNEYIVRDYLLCCYQASDWDFTPGWSGLKSRAHEIQVEMGLIDPAMSPNYRLALIYQFEYRLQLKPGVAHGHPIRPRFLARFGIPPDVGDYFDIPPDVVDYPYPKNPPSEPDETINIPDPDVPLYERPFHDALFLFYQDNRRVWDQTVYIDVSHRAYMMQYDHYWKNLKIRIDKTEYAHLYKIYDILTIEEKKLIATLSYGYDHDSWSKLRIIWRKKKANWFRRLSSKEYNDADTDRGIGMRRFAMHKVMIESA